MKVIIIGGVAGGASCAARLRRLDESARIILLERGEYISYANCGLPYYVGGEITDRGELTLQTPGSFSAQFRIDVRTGHEAVGIDAAGMAVEVRTSDGKTYREGYDKLLLSPGAEPLRPTLPGIDNANVFTLRTVPDALRIDEHISGASPRSAVVVGAGYIGLEMAENLARRGLAVTVVEAADHAVGPLDSEMACTVHRHLREKGVRLHLQSAVQSFSSSHDGLTVQLNDHALTADLVLLSVGVRPESGLAKAAGLRVGERGAIQVDEHLQTSDPHIYAVGDAVQVRNYVSGSPAFLPLAGPANKQGRIAADNLCGIPSVYKGTQGSSILRLFDLTVACTGLSERSARQAGISCDKVSLLSGSHAGYYPGGSTMLIKVLFETGTGALLGAQIVGEDGVDKRCDVLATAIRAGMTAADLTGLELCYAPPFSSAKDPVNMAGYVMENLLTGKVRQHHWHDVDALPRDGSVTLLDVRTQAEYTRGHIEGAAHIPVDCLRERLGELDPGKPVYVNCQSGLRSYLSCRILSQNGFDCSNLAGGYHLYALTEEVRAAGSSSPQ